MTTTPKKPKLKPHTSLPARLIAKKILGNLQPYEEHLLNALINEKPIKLPIFSRKRK